MKFRDAIITAAMAVTLFSASAARADVIAFSVASVTDSNHDPNNVNLGSVFSISSAITVTSLGVYDSSYLKAPETVTLYDSVGNALASQVFSSLGGPSQYIFSAVAPIVLTPGTYTVSAFTNGNAWAYGVSNTAPGINFLLNDYLYAGSPQFPSTCCGSGPNYFGANFEFTTARTAVPEPMSLSLVGAGLAGIAALRRRKRAKPA